MFLGIAKTYYSALQKLKVPPFKIENAFIVADVIKGTLSVWTIICRDLHLWVNRFNKPRFEENGVNAQAFRLTLS